MTKFLCCTPLLLLFSPLLAQAEDKPLLAVSGTTIYENKFDAAVGEPWKVAKGKWELASGVWRASEKADDMHPAVARLPNKFGDFVLEYEFKFAGAKQTTLSINGVKGHMARIVITPKQVSFQKDDSDHDGPDKAIVFTRLPASFESDAWHRVRMEIVGDTMLGKVDDLTGWGSHDSFKNEHLAGLTVSGESVSFRNFKLSEAKPNPDWDKVKASLPAPKALAAAGKKPAAK